MQAIDLRPFMESAVTEVLEAMFFVSSEGEAADEAGQFDSDWVCGELNFTGETCGTFGIAVPPATAAVIAANFLGEEEEVITAKETSEVVCELTNMVCGSLLAQINSQTSFTLSPPQPGRHSLVADTRHERIHRTYAIDEGCLHAWVEMKIAA